MTDDQDARYDIYDTTIQHSQIKNLVISLFWLFILYIELVAMDSSANGNNPIGGTVILALYITVAYFAWKHWGHVVVDGLMANRRAANPDRFYYMDRDSHEKTAMNPRWNNRPAEPERRSIQDTDEDVSDA